MADADSAEQSSAHEWQTPPTSFWDEVVARTELAAKERETIERHISRGTIIHGIGNLIVEFQLLETGIRDAISFLVNAENRDIGLITAAPLSFRHMLSVLYALFCSRIKDDSEREKLRKLFGECDRCAEHRNNIVHSFWYQDVDGNNIRLKLKVDRKGEGYGKQPEKVVEEMLDAYTSDCITCAGQLTKLMTRHFPGWLRSG